MNKQTVVVESDTYKGMLAEMDKVLCNFTDTYQPIWYSNSLFPIRTKAGRYRAVMLFHGGNYYGGEQSQE